MPLLVTLVVCDGQLFIKLNLQLHNYIGITSASHHHLIYHVSQTLKVDMYRPNLNINISGLPEGIFFLHAHDMSHDCHMIAYTMWHTSPCTICTCTHLRKVPLLSFNIILVHFLHPVLPFQELIPVPHPGVAIVQVPHLHLYLCPSFLQSTGLWRQKNNLKSHLE